MGFAEDLDTLVKQYAIQHSTARQAIISVLIAKAAELQQLDDRQSTKDTPNYTKG